MQYFVSGFFYLEKCLWFHQCTCNTAAAKSLQSCPTLCDPIDGSHQAPPSLGFSRQEHWSGLPFPFPMHESEKWKWEVKVKSLSFVRLLATPWTAAFQAPPSMGFSRQEYWSAAAAAAAKSLQSCPTLCDPIDCSPPGSAIPGILQARTLEWVAIAFSNACASFFQLLNYFPLYEYGTYLS